MLGNFTYSNPTKLYFGQDSLNALHEELPKYGKTVMLIYGGGSIKKTGLYDKITAILKQHNKQWVEDNGVMPNPTLEKLHEGCKIARSNQVDLILALGGGSVCDYAKAVSASAYCESDPWETFYLNEQEVTNQIIPVGCILTMVGTGSEMNGGSVITNTATKQKIGRVFDEAVYPKFSILNPLFTYTVPTYQMTAGFFDIMSHILEQYFSGQDDNTSDYVMEGLLKSLIHSTRIAIKNPHDYPARSNIMWTSTWALNTFAGKGKDGDWMVHSIGQAISAYTDATHGMTLAAVSIPYYHHILPFGLAKFKRYAINVWNIDPSGMSDEDVAKAGLNAMASYMKEMGLVMKISDLGVTSDMIEGIASSCYFSDGAYKTLTHEDVVSILQQSM